MRKAAQKADDITIEARKRNMRNQPTKAEFKLWSMIKDKSLGVKFLRQENIRHDRNDIGYYADYACYERGLIIEVDNPLNAERAKDKERNQYFQDGNFTILRFRDKEILGNPIACLAKIKKIVILPELE